MGAPVHEAHGEGKHKGTFPGPLPVGTGCWEGAGQSSLGIRAC